jgi:hypothetical protein
MNRIVVSRFLLLCGLILSFAFAAFAQEATIVGSVTDQSGLAVPNVTITITNMETGHSQTVSSNNVGQFVVPALRIGSYSVKTEAKGFKAWSQKDLKLQVGDRARLDIQLQVGTATESITVEGGALQVQAVSSEVSDVVTGTQVMDLATNGRNFVMLAALTPGASSAVSGFQFPAANSTNFNISFNGQNPDHNVWMVDGAEAYDRGSGGKFSFMPSTEALAEFRTLTSNYSADFGLSSGAMLTMAFKSGTSSLHGGLWEFVRNDAFDANDYFSNRAGLAKPILKYNVYGFNLGGPVALGKYNKDHSKTFFFYNMEWRKLRGTSQLNNNDPAIPWRTGDLSSWNGTLMVPTAVAPSQLTRFTALGLTPGKPFPGNKIPASLIDPNATAFLAAGTLPPPTSVDSSGIGHLLANAPAPHDTREELARIDHRINGKVALFGHFAVDHDSFTNVTSMWSGDSYPTVGSLFNNPSYSAVVHSAHIISPTVVNEMAFNYSSNTIGITATGDVYKNLSGFSVPQLAPGSTTRTMLPNMNFAGEINANWQANWQPWKNSSAAYQLRDDLSWTRGRHQLKFGLSFMEYNKAQDTFGVTQGTFNFNGTYTGSAFADFLLGYASAYQQDALHNSGLWHDQTYSIYAQDNWRVTDRFTLNLGVRWEGMPHTYETQNQMSNFYSNLYSPSNIPRYIPGTSNLDPTGPGFSTVSSVTLSSIPFYLNGIGLAGKNGIPAGLVQDHWNLWAPRIGFAWDLTGKGRTVIRAGFGRTYERVQGNDVYGMATDVPFSYQTNLSNVLLSNPATSALTGLTAAAPVGPAGLTTLAYSDYKAPTSNQWSLGVQHELWPRAVLSVAYVGSLQNHQNVYVDINAPWPSNTTGRAAVVAGTQDVNQIRPYLGYSSIRQSQNSENGHYNGLQTNFRIQAQKGLTLQAAWTLSKSINTVPGGPGGGDLQNASNPYNLKYDYGLSPFDRKSVLILNFVYDLPFFANASNRIQKSLLGGWQISGVVTTETGLAITPTYNNTSLGMGGNVANHPDLNGSVSYPQTVTNWFSAAPFAAPAPLAFGSASKGCLRGPGLNTLDTSVFKNFRSIPWFTKEGAGLQLRFEFFNTLNHTEFSAVQANFSSRSDFGAITSVYPARQIQLGARFTF